MLSSNAKYYFVNNEVDLLSRKYRDVHFISVLFFPSWFYYQNRKFCWFILDNLVKKKRERLIFETLASETLNGGQFILLS